jgi:hypothetical protein
VAVVEAVAVVEVGVVVVVEVGVVVVVEVGVVMTEAEGRGKLSGTAAKETL